MHRSSCTSDDRALSPRVITRAAIEAYRRRKGMEIGSQITVVIIKIDLECATKRTYREQAQQRPVRTGAAQVEANALAVVAWIVWAAAIATQHGGGKAVVEVELEVMVVVARWWWRRRRW